MAGILYRPPNVLSIIALHGYHKKNYNRKES